MWAGPRRTVSVSPFLVFVLLFWQPHEICYVFSHLSLQIIAFSCEQQVATVPLLHWSEPGLQQRGFQEFLRALLWSSVGSSYEVASRPGGNSRCCPAHRREEKRAAACADLKKKYFTGRVWFEQRSSCSEWAEKGFFSISATAWKWKWKCHFFQHFHSSRFSPSPPHIPLAIYWS